MVKTPTLFVLGAGASCPYGLPLGAELTRLVASYIRKNKPALVEHAEGEIVGEIFRLAEIINNSRTPTLDMFIQKNRRYADYIRLAIAGVIARFENNALQDQDFPDGDWLAWLYHVILESPPDRFVENKVAFLNFNYDRIPQGLLARFMANTYGDRADNVYQNLIDECVEWRVPSGQWVELKRFVHMHGAVNTKMQLPRNKSGEIKDLYGLSSLDLISRMTGDRLRDMAAELIATPESHRNLETANDIFNSAKKLVFSARKIIFLGLGYHEDNLRKIHLEKLNCEELGEQLEFFGGTGMSIHGRNRERILDRMGPNFVLGDPDQDCLSYLQEYLV